MKSTYIVIDTETNGVYGWNNHYTNISNWYMLQLGYILYNVDGTEILRNSHLIKNENIHNNGKSLEVNNITDEYRNKNGITIKTALLTLFNVMMRYNCKCIVTHGTDFDVGLLIVECFRNFIDYPFKNNTYIVLDTKLSYHYINKHMNLSETLISMGKTIETENCHDAVYDCELCNMLLRDTLPRSSLKIDHMKLYKTVKYYYNKNNTQ